MSPSDVSLLADELDKIRGLSSGDLLSKFRGMCSSKVPGPDFMNKLDASGQDTVSKCCLLLYAITGTKIPRQFQLEATLALTAGRDCLIHAATGSGKTLCMVLPALLDPTAVSLVISPLKRLQVLQVAEFQSYGLTAACINEDTPNSTEFWNSVQAEKFRILVVQPEQLQPFSGHLPRLAQLIRHTKFSKLIKQVHVDEAHTIYTAGIPLYGQPPFRPAWGHIGELRLWLRKNTPFQALSGTLPRHIVRCISENLLFQSDYVPIQLTLNRPNITYAAYPITGALSNFRNLQFLIPEHAEHPFDPKLIPKTIIFHDNLQEASNAAKYLNSHLPEAGRHMQVAKHYHSVMSAEYLEHTFRDFASPNGVTRILCATSGASTGLDVSDISCVIQYGMCRDVPNFVQRGGRGGRSTSISAVFLLLYEPWALTAELPDPSSSTDPSQDLDDPDRPLRAITKSSKKPERTGLAMYRLVQSSKCIRKIFADYLSDKTPTAIEFTNRFCCDRHDNGFELVDFFPGKLQTENPTVFINLTAGMASRTRYRPVKEREPLKALLYAWRSREHQSDPLRGVRQISWILADADIETICKIPRTSLENIEQLKSLLGSSSDWLEEWGQKVVNEVCSFNANDTIV